MPGGRDVDSYRSPVLQSTSDAKPYKPNARVESFRSLLERLLSVYSQDRYEAGLVGVFAVPLPRVQVQVNEEMVEQAKGEETTQAANEDGPEEAMETQEEEGDEGVKGQGEDKGTDQPEQTTADEVMVDVQDDPAETAKAMEGVEADAKETKLETMTLEEDNETEGETKIVIHIVANRYKLSNYW